MLLRGFLVSVVTVCLLAPAARAEGIDVASGGPKPPAAKKQALAALAGIAPALRVCWRGSPPARVTVDIQVDRRGRITRAAADGGGAAGQCAAGVLAVHELPATGSSWKARLRIDTAAPAEVDLHAELRKHQSRLQRCGGDARGTVGLRFLIHPDGRLSGAEIAHTSLKDDAVHRCLTTTIEKLRIAERPGGKTVSYTLEVGLGRTATSASTTTGSGADTPSPSKKGPVEGAVIQAGIDKLSERFARCYRKRSKKDARGYVMIRFTIRADGTVRNVKVRESTLDDAKVEGCVVGAGKDLRFPGEQGRDETRVFYPISFSP
jgi:TonB family protein